MPPLNNRSESSETDSPAPALWLFPWKAVVFLGVVLAAAAAAYHYGRHWYQQRQERQLAQHADDSLNQGDLKHAYFYAQMGLQLDPNNEGAMRIIATLLAASGNTNALYWGKRIRELNPDFTNQLALAAWALQVEPAPFPTAAQILNSVAPAQQHNPDYQRLAGRLALRLAQTQAAAGHFAQLVQLEPANWTNQLDLAAIQLHSTNAADQQAALASLQRLAGQTQSRTRALRLLVVHSMEQNETARAEQFSLQLATQPDAGVGDHTTLLTILQARHNADFTNHLVLAETQAGTNEQAVMVLADWMNTHGCARLTLDWLAHLPPALVQQGALPATAAEAYASLGEWPAMEKYLLRTNWPALEPFRQAYLSRAAEQLGNSTEDEAAWTMAVTQSAPSADNFRLLVRMTLAWNWPEREEQLLWLTAERHPNQSWVWPILTQLVQKKNETRQMLRLAKLIYGQHPEDDRRANDYAAYALLLNEDWHAAQEIARANHQRHPDDAVMATTCALAGLKAGDTNAALAAFQNLSPASLDVPVIAAYYGLALAVCGDQTKARIYLDRSASARLLPEEASLVALAKNNPQQLMAELVPPSRNAVGLALPPAQAGGSSFLNDHARPPATPPPLK